MRRIVAARGPLLWLGPHRTLETAEWHLLFGAVGQGRAHAGWLHPFTVRNDRRWHGFGGQKVGMTADRRLRQEVAMVFEHEAFALAEGIEVGPNLGDQVPGHAGRV